MFVLSLDHVAGCRQSLLELFHSVSAVDLEEEGGEDDEDTETSDGREAVLVDDAGQEDGQGLGVSSISLPSSLLSLVITTCLTVMIMMKVTGPKTDMV